MSYELRNTTLQDLEALETLIARSARQLCAQAYTTEQIAGALH